MVSLAFLASWREKKGFSIIPFILFIPVKIRIVAFSTTDALYCHRLIIFPTSYSGGKMLRSIRKILAILTVFAMLGLPMSVLAAGQININKATATQLQSVNGVGEKTADKIIAFREQHGQFTSVDELCKVQGIGEKSIQKMSGQICIK